MPFARVHCLVIGSLGPLIFVVRFITDNSVKPNQAGSCRITSSLLFQQLQDVLASEERRRVEAVKAVEEERRRIADLHQELAAERGKSHEEIVQWKKRWGRYVAMMCEPDLSSSIAGETQKRESQLQHSIIS